MHPLRKTVLGKTVTVLLTAGLLAASVPSANAAGGGCRPHSNAAFSFDACQGDDGRMVYGDTYIKSFTGNDCKVTISVHDGTSDTYPCKLGHLGPQSANMRRGINYSTSIKIESSAGQLFGISPRSWRP